MGWVLNRYEYTESAVVKTVIKLSTETPPTTDPGTEVRVIQQWKETDFVLKQTNSSLGFRTRCGFFKPSGFDAGPDKKSLYDISFPYDIDLMSGDYFVPSGTSAKNRAWVEISPNLDLDVLAAGAAIDANVVTTDTEVVLNATAKAALDGMLSEDNGIMQKDEVFFRLTSVPADETDFTNLRKAHWDSDNSKLVSPDGSQFNLTATSGDKVYITIRFEDGSYLAPGTYVRIGDETLGSSTLPANTVIRFIILNEDGTALEMGFNLTYLHS